ncbi:MAG: hypothetical protein RIS47_1984, partial [Bacteroidota bacterium]
SKMKTYCQTNQYNWPIWHWDYKPEVAKSFEIRTFPTCYLIDPDGNLKFSPAPLLSEGFREQFQPILDQMRRDSFKNQGVKKQ